MAPGCNEIDLIPFFFVKPTANCTFAVLVDPYLTLKTIVSLSAIVRDKRELTSSTCHSFVQH